ncbi:hypothetical protein K461DRAFT_47742 [Myriangium duriaei CBS 260.36]|uniref:WW domain-containing protein n=1 Tax=Myriangium duriaei CBS 260.36 TaxID=1168546 RepID=A0A9P4ME29_9PEZI|nr:hypothetical protein K461DRAFT_47742 [Myriangium duriaei CBS 260.36]
MEEPPQKRLKSDSGAAAELAPLPPGWTEHTAPTGHKYYYNKSTKKSTYTRPSEESAVPSAQITQPPAQSFTQSYTGSYHTPPFQANAQYSTSSNAWNSQPNGSQYSQQPFYNGNTQPQPVHQMHDANRQPQHGSHRPRRQPEDRPKRKEDIPNCGAWILVYTRLGRRFVHNTETCESFWKFPADVMKAVIALDQMHLEEKHGKLQNGASQDKQETGESRPPTRPEDIGIDEEAITRHQADMDKSFKREQAEDALLLEGDEEERIWVPPAQTTADKGYDSSEYEEIEVTDDSDLDSNADAPPSDDDQPPGPLEFNEDDIAYQLAAMGESYGLDEEEYGSQPESPTSSAAEAELTDTERQQIFEEMLTDHGISPFTPWESLLEGPLLDDERFTIITSSRARKDAHAAWCKAAIAKKKAAPAAEREVDPRERFLAFLATAASTKLYWPEFKRKFKKEAALKAGQRWGEREMEKCYREFVAGLKMGSKEKEAKLREVTKGKGKEGVRGEVAYWVVGEGRREKVVEEVGR